MKRIILVLFFCFYFHGMFAQHCDTIGVMLEYASRDSTFKKQFLNNANWDELSIVLNTESIEDTCSYDYLAWDYEVNGLIVFSKDKPALHWSSGEIINRKCLTPGLITGVIGIEGGVYTFEFFYRCSGAVVIFVLEMDLGQVVAKEVSWGAI